MTTRCTTATCCCWHNQVRCQHPVVTVLAMFYFVRHVPTVSRLFFWWTGVIGSTWRQNAATCICLFQPRDDFPLHWHKPHTLRAYPLIHTGTFILDTTSIHPSRSATEAGAADAESSSDEGDAPDGGSEEGDGANEVPFVTHGTQDTELQDVVR